MKHKYLRGTFDEKLSERLLHNMKLYGRIRNYNGMNPKEAAGVSDMKRD